MSKAATAKPAPVKQTWVEKPKIVLSIEDAGKTVDAIKRAQTIGHILMMVLTYAFILFLALVMVFPFYWMIITSLKQRTEIVATTQTFFPTVVMWSNYTYVFQVFDFGIYMGNTIVVAIFSTLGTLLTTIFAAFAFARLKFKGRESLFMVFLMTMMIPTQVMVVPQYIILKKLNLDDTLLSMMLPWMFGYAFFIFLIVQYMRGIPKELDEAAEIDGCGRIGILFRILVPVVQPAIVSASIFAFYWIWQDFFQPLIFVGSPENYTIPLALKMYTDPNSFSNYGGLFAMSVVSLLPVILVFVFFQKYLVEGIATDGIKG